MTVLSDYLRHAAAIPFVWGTHDCVLFGADWIAMQTGTDPAAEYRGRYTSSAEAAKIIGRAGGLLAVISAAMDAGGFSVTDDPRPGDVGLVSDGQSEAFAIRTAARWAGKTERGLYVVETEFRRAWSIPCRLS